MRTRGMVPARASLLCVATLALTSFASARTQAAVPCDKVNQYFLAIDANGYTGKIQCGGLSTNPDGSVSANCKALFPGEPDDTVKLTCKDRHVTFARTRPGVFIQNYSGWMYTGGVLRIAGDFSHNSTERTYGWCGSFSIIIP